MNRKLFGDESIEVARAINNLGCVYYNIGNFKESEVLNRGALETKSAKLGRKNLEVVATLINLGAASVHMKEYDNASGYLNEALDTLLEITGAEHPHYGEALGHLGSMHFARLELEEAAKCFNQALEIRRRVSGYDHPICAEYLSKLGDIFRASGKYNEAERIYKEVIEVSEASLQEEHPRIIEATINLAIVYAATGRTDDSLKLLIKASRLADKMISQVFSFASEHQRMEYVDQTRSALSIFLSLVVKYFKDNQTTIHDVLSVVLRRKAIASEALAAQRDMVYGGKYPELKDKLSELANVRTDIALRAFNGPGPEGKDAHNKLLKDWTEQKNLLESSLPVSYRR